MGVQWGDDAEEWVKVSDGAAQSHTRSVREGSATRSAAAGTEARRKRSLDDEADISDVGSASEAAAPKRGHVSLGTDIVSHEELDSFEELAGQIRLKGSLTPKRVEGLLEQIRTDQSLPKAEFAELEKYARHMRSWHRSLHQQYRESGYSDQKVDAQLTKVHQFLHQWDGARERFRIQARTEELGRISEGSPSFTPTTAAFYTFANISQRDMKSALAIMDRIDDGEKRVVIDGNKTTVLTRDGIWQAKMRMLDAAIADAENGKPTEIDVQYYELTSQTMLSRLAQAARAGCKVRVNLDPGRMIPDRSDDSVNASEIAKKMLTAYRLLDTAAQGADIGLTLFPVEREIGDTNLMHQKLFRVGDAVILGGMNANSLSGENVDAAVLVEGPGAKRLVEVFERDTKLSTAAKLNDIYNPRNAALLAAGGAYVGPAALMAMLMSAAGPQVRSLEGPRLDYNRATLESLAKTAGTRLDKLIDVTDANGKVDVKKLEAFLDAGDTPSNVVPLKPEGGRLLAGQVREVVRDLATKGNVARASDISAPSGRARGSDQITVGDSSNERVAIVLQAISTAEKFVYVPSFVMTRVVARALVARYEELKAEGKDLDVRVVLDPGIYPDGGTPNAEGYLALEDAGIPVRWARLARTTPEHDRKIHAKAIITEKSAMLGSTNLSTKGLKSNWELSGLVTFDPDDRESKSQHEALVRDFMQTWDYESIRVDTHAVAESRLGRKKLPDRDARVEEARYSAVLATIRTLNTYEQETAEVVADLVAADPQVQQAISDRMATGMTRGYATLLSLQEKMGMEGFAAALDRTKAAATLAELAAGRYPFAS